MKKIIFGIILSVSVAQAKPLYLNSLRTTYAELDSRNKFSCTICHQGAPKLNLFGRDFAQLKAQSGGDLAKTWLLLEPLDSDGDQVRNIDEMKNGTNPGVR